MKWYRFLISTLTAVLIGSLIPVEAQPLPSSAVACHFVIRAYLNIGANGQGVAEVAGYITDIPGISDSLFNGSPSEKTAFLTFRSFTKASEFVNEDVSLRYDLLASWVGDSAATEIDGFLRLYASLGSLEDIIEHPETATLPSEPSARYAVCTGLARLATRKNFKQIMKFADRLDGEGQVLLVHDATMRDAKLKETSEYGAWAVNNQSAIMQS